MLKLFLIVIFFTFSFNSFGIFNMKDNKEEKPDIKSKKWLILSQNCHTCSELLVDLKSLCGGKKPPPQQLGFLISGSSPQAMLDKIKNFKDGYELFSGSPNEFYEHYTVISTPSLINVKKVIAGKSAILKFLKNDKKICSS